MQLHTYKSFSTLWAQINKIRNERGEITANTTEIQRKKKEREYHEQLYANNLDNLEEMEDFLEINCQD